MARIACPLPGTALDLGEWCAATAALGTEPAAYGAQMQALLAEADRAFAMGRYIDDLVKDLSRGIDLLLVQAWRQLGLADRPGLALLAVGGYGRREMFPASDIDLLILHPPAPDEAQQEALAGFLRLLWDSGLDVAPSARPVDDCIAAGRGDLTIATNLMEARLLAGDAALFQVLQERVDAPDFWPAADFFRAKMEERQRRYRRFGDTAYRLEPNLKESPGGLRDLQVVAWVAKRFFGVSSLRSLIGRDDFIEIDEYNTFCGGRNYLWRVRYALHREAGRKEDRLLFEYQRPLAARLGYGRADDNGPVERFMQDYFRTVMQLERLVEICVQHFDEELLSPPDAAPRQPLNERFELRNGYLAVRDPAVFRERPTALLEVFLLLQTHPEVKGAHARTIRLIRKHLRRIDDDLHADPAAHRLFMDILRQPRGVYHTLRLMNVWGVLAAYIPAFAHTVGLMQFDLFHIYTVDEHILMVLRYARRLADPRHRGELPKAEAIFDRLDRPELLYLGALFHDIGKGLGGDHSQVGKDIARDFCLGHGLPPDDAGLVAWLVEQHLVMSLTAQRKDISDPDVIREFGERVGDVRRLDYLYLLTISDIRGTNPSLWNDWKANLLAQLYNATRRWLESHPSPSETQLQQASDHRLAALRLLGGTADPARTARLLDGLDTDYLRRFPPTAIASHLRCLLDDPTAATPHVEVFTDHERGATAIALCARTHPRLFCLATRAITRLSLDIVGARIHTTDGGVALDLFHVLEASGEPCDPGYRSAEIRERLLADLDDPRDCQPHPRRALPRHLRAFNVATVIHFSQPAGKPFTVLDIRTTNRPGLLADIAVALSDAGIRIRQARIATVSEEAQDILEITDHADRPLAAPEQEALRRRLSAVLAG